MNCLQLSQQYNSIRFRLQAAHHSPQNTDISILSIVFTKKQTVNDTKPNKFGWQI